MGFFLFCFVLYSCVGLGRLIIRNEGGRWREGGDGRRLFPTVWAGRPHPPGGSSAGPNARILWAGRPDPPGGSSAGPNARILWAGRRVGKPRRCFLSPPNSTGDGRHRHASSNLTMICVDELIDGVVVVDAIIF